MKEFMNLLVKLGPGDLNRQDEPRIQGESWKRIKSLCAAAASIRKVTNGVSVETAKRWKGRKRASVAKK